MAQFFSGRPWQRTVDTAIGIETHVGNAYNSLKVEIALPTYVRF
jgi:hypothetical protein